jgi:hypothetical protein
MAASDFVRTKLYLIFKWEEEALATYKQSIALLKTAKWRDAGDGFVHCAKIFKVTPLFSCTSISCHHDRLVCNL